MKLTEFIGNKQALSRIKLNLDFANEYNAKIPHMGFFGAAGNGKTTLGRICAEYTHRRFVYINATAVHSPLQFRKVIVDRKNRRGAIVFLDECHGLPKKIQTNLLTLLEEPSILITPRGKDDFWRDELPPSMTFILATTHAGNIEDALLSRLDSIQINEYSVLEKLTIGINYLSKKYNIGKNRIQKKAILEIARRSRSGRDVIKNCDRTFKCMMVTGSSIITTEIVETSFRMTGIDANGLSPMDRKILNYLNTMGRASLETLAAELGVSKKEIKEKIEPYLLKNRFIVRRSVGRVITERGKRANRGERLDVSSRKPGRNNTELRATNKKNIKPALHDKPQVFVRRHGGRGDAGGPRGKDKLG